MIFFGSLYLTVFSLLFINFVFGYVEYLYKIVAILIRVLMVYKMKIIYVRWLLKVQGVL